MLILFQGQFFKRSLRKVKGKKKRGRELPFEKDIFLYCLIFISGNSIKCLDREIIEFQK